MSSHNDSFAASGSSPTRGKPEQVIPWVDEHICSENGFQPYWPTVVIEHRFVSDIVQGIRNDGLAVA